MKWYYKSIYCEYTVDEEIREFLDKQGNNGWELVSFIPNADMHGILRYLAIFKQPNKE